MSATKEATEAVIPEYNCPLPVEVNWEDLGDYTKWPNVRSWCELIQNECINEYQNLDINLVAAVMMIESGGDPNAISKKYATGLMQVMPDFTMPGRPSQKELLNPVFNLEYGCGILSDKINDWGSVKDGLWAYYGTASYYADYADPVLSKLDSIKAAYP
ncbi:MAG: Lytic transglycosylase catalytic [Microgenomates group bacterium GW2011_GWC1_43_13]|uniref:Lytic transglycosylase catalytic n=3 Tax=Candidatus Woeseibacteriota TaxID=1752722 RepID=A0A837I8P8_9BACT|nr:MAG: Lytic transglycosylase catalytic [Microgenomates group bacterium GW2011_GWC1_43_13]KKT33250.1 MAG: Lytic transglycosylase catalytic [Candidatus Woesebacteria bacterium GW2011_GWB1_44_11]KKT53686.1 MAG: Lytic transglycosylase catalytic [Candidatus Woesebacteria bacterium GW2011_GWA1_44_23]OGM76624.1 MAG: hypothetical protein A2208_01590 [Candidatus Woesebacteria bacterium RIFOXYA1_FULL_43_16]OGM84773.1 MAG: hypothetical protein A2421_00120 [Candidatus Woesebacteria bacterium RIFOXYC1_FUL